MNIWERLLCGIGLHKPPPGWNPRWAIYGICERCGDRIPGRMGVKR